jgi:hypothetical protein
MTLQKVKRKVIAALVVLLCLYMLPATFYIVVKDHSLKEWIAFSTNPHRIRGKITDLLGLPPRRWDRSEQWHRHRGNPVLATSLPGSWDEGIATFASVIKDDNGFKMYYSGRRNDLTGGQIGLAVSKDGENWAKHHGNPIVHLGQPGSWDDTMIWCPMVWKEEFYHMIYTGRNSSGIMQIGYATSTDGVRWTKNPNNPVFNDPSWAHDHTEGWGVIRVRDKYLLWYNTLGMTTRQVGVAVSTDLINWRPYKDFPIFASAEGTDRYHQFCAFPFRYGRFYYLIVTSQDSSQNWATFYLYRCETPYFCENDRECVKKILLPGRFRDWDDHDLDTPALLTLDVTRTTFYQNQFWLYYSGEGGDDRWKEGLLIDSNVEHCLQMPDQRLTE